MMVAEDERATRSTAGTTCSRCMTTVPIAETARALAMTSLASSTNPETRQRASIPAEVDATAAAYSARDAGWEHDWDAGNGSGSSAWLCPTCAEIVAVERKAPCPAWCTNCDGYDYFAEGTTHRRSWLDAGGVLVAEVSQNVPFGDETDGWTVATLFQHGPEEKTLAGLRAVAALAEEVATFVETHSLVLTTVEGE